MWFPKLGVGYFPVKSTPYDQAYFDKYARYAETDLGKRLNEFRLNLVSKYYVGDRLVDVGIGSGQFVEARNAQGRKTHGYDVNSAGVRWLRDRSLFVYPYDGGVEPEAITCWDVLEHIKNPEDLVERVRQFIFVSIPIFRDAEHVLQSKHYRRDEHYWYFTADGLVRMMRKHGFACLDVRDDETRLGREDIGSFVFRRA